MPTRIAVSVEAEVEYCGEKDAQILEIQVPCLGGDAMRRLMTFILGMITGGVVLFGAMSYHLIRRAGRYACRTQAEPEIGGHLCRQILECSRGSLLPSTVPPQPSHAVPAAGLFLSKTPGTDAAGLGAARHDDDHNRG